MNRPADPRLHSQTAAASGMYIVPPPLSTLAALAAAPRTVKAGEPLFHAGGAFSFLYAVRSGTFRRSVPSRRGTEQVTGFQIAGDVLGLDGIATGSFSCTAVALEDSQVCAIRYADLLEAGTREPQLRRTLCDLLGSALLRDQEWLAVVAAGGAEERCAAFLLDFSARMQARGYSATEFHLRMDRADIGSFLGLTLESVSRAFSSFARQGILQVDRKHLRIADLPALMRVVEHTLH